MGGGASPCLANAVQSGPYRRGNLASKETIMIAMKIVGNTGNNHVMSMLLTKDEAMLIWRLAANMNTFTAEYYGDSNGAHANIYKGMCDVFGASYAYPNETHPNIQMDTLVTPVSKDALSSMEFDKLPLRPSHIERAARVIVAEMQKALDKKAATITENHAVQGRMAATISAQTKDIDALKDEVARLRNLLADVAGIAKSA
jgi:hypothetical protein